MHDEPRPIFPQGITRYPFRDRINRMRGELELKRTHSRDVRIRSDLTRNVSALRILVLVDASFRSLQARKTRRLRCEIQHYCTVNVRGVLAWVFAVVLFAVRVMVYVPGSVAARGGGLDDPPPPHPGQHSIKTRMQKTAKRAPRRLFPARIATRPKQAIRAA